MTSPKFGSMGGGRPVRHCLADGADVVFADTGVPRGIDAPGFKSRVRFMVIE